MAKVTATLRFVLRIFSRPATAAGPVFSAVFEFAHLFILNPCQQRCIPCRVEALGAAC